MIVDTVYLVAYLNPEDPLHGEARGLLEGGGGWRVSCAALLELDLLMKARGFSPEERVDTWSLLSAVIGERVEPLLPRDLELAALLQEKRGMDYFDSLVAAQCINRGARPATTDKEVLEAVEELAG